MAERSRTAEQIEALRARVAAIPGWYHAVDLGDGVVTPGPFAIADFVDEYDLPADLSSQRVLDVGCGNGAFCVEFVARGAAEVVGLDVPAWLERDWNPTYRHRYVERTTAPERRSIDEIMLRGAFELIADELGAGRVRRLEARVQDLDPSSHGTFDLVFCASMLMHVRDPLLALQRLRAVCADTGRLIVSTSVPPQQDDRPTALFVGAPGAGNYWQLTPACLRHMLACADFEPVGAGHHFGVRDRPTGRGPERDEHGRPVDPRSLPGSGAFRDPHYVCHARPTNATD